MAVHLKLGPQDFIHADVLLEEMLGHDARVGSHHISLRSARRRGIGSASEELEGLAMEIVEEEFGEDRFGDASDCSKTEAGCGDEDAEAKKGRVFGGDEAAEEEGEEEPEGVEGEEEESAQRVPCFEREQEEVGEWAGGSEKRGVEAADDASMGARIR